jgi:hypothetical protein
MDWANSFRPNQEPPSPPTNPNTLTETDFRAAIQELTNSQYVLTLAITELCKGLEAGALNSQTDIMAELSEQIRVLQHGNIEALVTANQQFMTIIMRRLEEMEERLSSDTPAFTNILYSSPELFTEISEREDPDQQPAWTTLDDEWITAYREWKNPEAEGSWQSFVKACGGPKKAKEIRLIIEDSPLIEQSDS